MKAMLTDEQKNLVWTEVDRPVPKADEVLIETKAFSLNRADLMQRNGDYPSPPGCPPWMGLEIAGTIAEIGETAKKASNFNVGDRVCALLGGGGYAEFSAVQSGMVMPIPNGFSFAEAAAIPECYATAYLNLFYEGNLKKGETFLVFAGASGVGIAATQLAKLWGAKVIATVRSDEKAEKIKKFGADLIVNTKTTDIETVFSQQEIDLVLDCVGGPDMGKCFGRMARYGRWIDIATLGGDVTELDLKTVYKKGLRLIGSTLRSRTPEMKAEILKKLTEEVFPHFASGALRPEIYKTFSVEQTDEAHAMMAANENIGKLVITL